MEIDAPFLATKKTRIAKEDKIQAHLGLCILCVDGVRESAGINLGVVKFPVFPALSPSGENSAL